MGTPGPGGILSLVFGILLRVSLVAAMILSNSSSSSSSSGSSSAAVVVVGIKMLMRLRDRTMRRRLMLAHRVRVRRLRMFTLARRLTVRMICMSLILVAMTMIIRQPLHLHLNLRHSRLTGYVYIAGISAASGIDYRQPTVMRRILVRRMMILVLA